MRHRWVLGRNPKGIVWFAVQCFGLAKAVVFYKLPSCRSRFPQFTFMLCSRRKTGDRFCATRPRAMRSIRILGVFLNNWIACQ